MIEGNSDFTPIGLGDRVKDPISGFQGIVTAVTTWLHGCIRVVVQPEELREGMPAADQAFDQSQLVLLAAKAHTPMVLTVAPAPDPIERRSNGGPVRERASHKRR